MSTKTKTFIKEWVGLIIATLTLVTMLVGYITFIYGMSKDIELIKTNELVHIQGSLADLQKNDEKVNDRLFNIEKAISRIEGFLSQ